MSNSDYQEKQLYLAIFNFFKKNLVIFLIAGFIGGGLGYILSKTLAPTFLYQTKVCSEIVQSELLHDTYSSVKRLIKNRDYKELSTTLNLPLDKAKQIRDLSTSVQESEFNKYNKDRRLFGENCIDFQLTLKDTSDKIEILQSVQNYLDKTPTFQKMLEANQNGNLQLQEYLERKSMDLDSIHQVVLNNPKDLPEFQLGFEDGMLMGLELQKVNQQLSYTNKVAMFFNSDFLVVRNHRRGLNYAVAGAFSLFFLALLFLLVKEINALSSSSSD
jgi:hypothetical protein